MRGAVFDLSWLLSRGYASGSAVKIVGDRYELSARQRTAVMRCACSDEARAGRRAREVGMEQVRGRRLLVDGYNVLTTIEAALGGGVILAGRDGCYRDMASIHGTYRKVEETLPALELAGREMEALGVGECVWYLDSPVSNSGRLKGAIEAAARERGWAWRVEVVPNPDRVLMGTEEVVASADSVVLDGCVRWFNLARRVVEKVEGAWVVEMSGQATERRRGGGEDEKMRG